MPVVLPNLPAPTSAAQTVPTVAVYDYLFNDAGKPLVGQVITVHLDTAVGTTLAPVVEVVPKGVLSVVTDANGYWTVPLVPNGNISPSGSTYVVETPFRSY